MSSKPKCNQNWNVLKTEMPSKLKCHQNWNVTKTEMSPKLKYQQNWNLTKTKHVLKITIQMQEIGPDCIGLVFFVLVLLSAHVERFSCSYIWDFFRLLVVVALIVYYEICSIYIFLIFFLQNTGFSFTSFNLLNNLIFRL